MPVLRRPLYRSQAIPWDFLRSPESFGPSVPIEEGEEGALEQAYREGYEAGYQAGLKAGREEGYQEGRAAAQQAKERMLERWGEALRREWEAFRSQAEVMLTETALEIARRVVEVEVQTNPQVVREAARKALEALGEASIVLRVHPEDGVLLQDQEWSSPRVRVVLDETMERGGVVAESDLGKVDLRPSIKFALLQEEVMGNGGGP